MSKPSVSTITKWTVCQDSTVGLPDIGYRLQIWESEVPFYGYFKLVYTPTKGKKITKYWYGENAPSDCARFAYDLTDEFVVLY